MVELNCKKCFVKANLKTIPRANAYIKPMDFKELWRPLPMIR
jgi:hypothetical protein